jgi:FkbM family methyltransferase
MSLRSLVRGSAQIAARAAIPLLAAGGSGVPRQLRRGIMAARRRDHVPKIDTWRFPSGEMPGYSPANTVRVLYRTRAMKEEIERAFDLLADDRSREILAAVIAFRALGPKHVELPVAADGKLQFYKQACRLKVGNAAEPFFYPYEMSLFEIDGIRLECWLGNLVASFFERQYFFERDGISIQPERGDTVIDAGACFGDTALAFAQAVGEKGRVHSFEPMPRQKAVLDRNLAHNPQLAGRIEVHPYAVLNESGKQLNFADAGVAARASSSGGVPVQSIAIDDFVAVQGVRPDFIKMDIEGAESAAIEGARTTLQTIRPKLGISIYHSYEDLFGIIRQIHAIEPAYEFYIDHHTVHSEETVLYAHVPQPKPVAVGTLASADL